jgi:hypothetical protein
MHTEKTRLFEDAYALLVEAHSEAMGGDLNEFEINRARKLLNFCFIAHHQFKDDERFSDLIDKEFQRFTEINNNF